MCNCCLACFHQGTVRDVLLEGGDVESVARAVVLVSLLYCSCIIRLFWRCLW